MFSLMCFSLQRKQIFGPETPIKVFALLALALLSSNLMAINQTDFRCLSVNEGLSSSLVYSNTIDADGFLWVATADGLNRYDGYTFDIFKHDDANKAGISGNSLKTVTADSSGAVWVGGASLNRYNPKHETFSNIDVSVGEYIDVIYQDVFGSIWVAGARMGFAQINAITGELIQAFTQANSALTDNTINAITGDENGNLWLATEVGIAYWNAQTSQLRYLRPSAYSGIEKADIIRDIIVDDDGFIWAATAAGLYRYDATHQQWQYFYHQPEQASSLISDDLWSVFQSRSGDIWIGTDKLGLARYLPEQQAFAHFPAGEADYLLPPGSVFDIAEDRSGGLWLSIYNYGVCRLNPKGKTFASFKHRNEANSLSFNTVLAIHEDKKGRIWLATDGGGLNQFDPKTESFQHYRHEEGNHNSLSSDSVIGIAEDAQGLLWLSTWQGGLNRFNPDTGVFKAYVSDSTVDNGLGGNNIFYVGFDTQNQLWLSVWDKGLYRFDSDNERFIAYTSDAKNVPFNVPNIHINTVHFSQNGIMWVGGHDGFSRVDRVNQTVETINLNKHHDVYDIYEDKSGILWLATVEGLLRYNPNTGQKQAFGVEQGLPSNFIVGIEADAQGKLWLGTRGGLATLNVDTFNVETFSVSDGLQSREFNRYSHTKTHDGSLYFGGTRGFNVIQPKAVIKNNDYPPVYITGLSLSHKPVGIDADGVLTQAVRYTERIALSAKQRDLTFTFASVNYAAAETARYRYRLLGYESNWVKVDSGNRSARYTNLEPGAYLFEVQTGNRDNTWNTKGASLEIAIARPWWAYRKIQLALMFVIIGFGYLFWRIRAAANRRQQWHMEELVEHKSNELNVALAQLELSNTLLESKVRERTLEYQHEIAVRRNAEKTLIHRAAHDALTGLPNRTWLREHLQNRLEQWRRAAGKPFALLYLDGDQFKLVNDSIGHHVGDQLLVAVAKRLVASLPSNAHVSRQGGDEFVVILDEVDNLDSVKEIAQALLNAMMEAFYIDDIELFFNVSIGVVMSADYYDRPEDILRDADIAMYHAKGNGKACYAVFDNEMYEQAEMELKIINGLKQAVEKDQLYLLHQPIVTLSDGSLAGFEALMRWCWEGNDPVGPDTFIPIAESNGLITELGEWALREACAQYKRWPHAPGFLGVNVSVKQLANEAICEQMEQLLAKHDIPASAIKLEITETALMENAIQAGAVLKRLEQKGIQLAIDDFGAGYSSLSYLQEFPVQHLKIDRSFIMKIDTDAGAREIVKTIISLAHSLGMKTIAEGIDSQERLDILCALGCDLGQGYWFAKPLSAEEAQTWIKD